MAEYHKEIAKIEGAFLGWEDHGILTVMLSVSFGGSGQSIGGYGLDGYDKDTKGRYGTAFGCEFIMRTMRACGVDDWRKVEGRTIHVLRETDEWNAKVVGIAPLPTESGEEFIFDELVQKHKEDQHG